MAKSSFGGPADSVAVLDVPPISQHDLAQLAAMMDYEFGLAIARGVDPVEAQQAIEAQVATAINRTDLANSNISRTQFASPYGVTVPKDEKVTIADVIASRAPKSKYAQYSPINDPKLAAAFKAGYPLADVRDWTKVATINALTKAALTPPASYTHYATPAASRTANWSKNIPDPVNIGIPGYSHNFYTAQQLGLPAHTGVITVPGINAFAVGTPYGLPAAPQTFTMAPTAQVPVGGPLPNLDAIPVTIDEVPVAGMMGPVDLAQSFMGVYSAPTMIAEEEPEAQIASVPPTAPPSISPRSAQEIGLIASAPPAPSRNPSRETQIASLISSLPSLAPALSTVLSARDVDLAALSREAERASMNQLAQMALELSPRDVDMAALSREAERQSMEQYGRMAQELSPRDVDLAALSREAERTSMAALDAQARQAQQQQIAALSPPAPASPPPDPNNPLGYTGPARASPNAVTLDEMGKVAQALGRDPKAIADFFTPEQLATIAQDALMGKTPAQVKDDLNLGFVGRMAFNQIPQEMMVATLDRIADRTRPPDPVPNPARAGAMVAAVPDVPSPVVPGAAAIPSAQATPITGLPSLPGRNSAAAPAALANALDIMALSVPDAPVFSELDPNVTSVAKTSYATPPADIRPDTAFAPNAFSRPASPVSLPSALPSFSVPQAVDPTPTFSLPMAQPSAYAPPAFGLDPIGLTPGVLASLPVSEISVSPVSTPNTAYSGPVDLALSQLPGAITAGLSSLPSYSPAFTGPQSPNMSLAPGVAATGTMSTPNRGALSLPDLSLAEPVSAPPSYSTPSISPADAAAARAGRAAPGLSAVSMAPAMSPADAAAAAAGRATPAQMAAISVPSSIAAGVASLANSMAALAPPAPSLPAPSPFRSTTPPAAPPVPGRNPGVAAPSVPGRSPAAAPAPAAPASPSPTQAAAAAAAAAAAGRTAGGFGFGPGQTVGSVFGDAFGFGTSFGAPSNVGVGYGGIAGVATGGGGLGSIGGGSSTANAGGSSWGGMSAGDVFGDAFGIGGGLSDAFGGIF